MAGGGGPRPRGCHCLVNMIRITILAPIAALRRRCPVRSMILASSSLVSCRSASLSSSDRAGTLMVALLYSYGTSSTQCLAQSHACPSLALAASTLLISIILRRKPGRPTKSTESIPWSKSVGHS